MCHRAVGSKGLSRYYYNYISQCALKQRKPGKVRVVSFIIKSNQVYNLLSIHDPEEKRFFIQVDSSAGDKVQGTKHNGRNKS